VNSARLKSQSQVNFESAHVNCDEGEKKGHKLAEILSLAVSCWKSRFIACIKLSSTKHPVGIPKHIASFEEAVMNKEHFGGGQIDLLGELKRRC